MPTSLLEVNGQQSDRRQMKIMGEVEDSTNRSRVACARDAVVVGASPAPYPHDQQLRVVVLCRAAGVRGSCHEPAAF
jgi:hypothetical protein